MNDWREETSWSRPTGRASSESPWWAICREGLVWVAVGVAAGAVLGAALGIAASGMCHLHDHSLRYCVQEQR